MGRRPRAASTSRAGRPRAGVDAERLRLLLREIFIAAGGTHDDFDAYDEVMPEERRNAVLPAGPDLAARYAPGPPKGDSPPSGGTAGTSSSWWQARGRPALVMDEGTPVGLVLNPPTPAGGRDRGLRRCSWPPGPATGLDAESLAARVADVARTSPRSSTTSAPQASSPRLVRGGRHALAARRSCPAAAWLPPRWLGWC